MNLSRILADLKIRESLNMKDVDITNISSDSRSIRKNGLFFAINGYTMNGADFIPQAVKNGAAAVVVDDDTPLSSICIPSDIPVVSLSDIRHAMATASCRLYNHPSRRLKLIGITGTNGKTTSSFMIKSILEAHGLKVGLIGSIAIYIGDRKLEATNRTTPESYQIQKTLARMADEKCDAAIIEVSSQAMKLDRVAGCEFNCALFTNLTKDHISPLEHKDMDDYFRAKLRLMEASDNIVINLDNEYTARIPSLLPDKNITTFGIYSGNCDIYAKDLKPSTSFTDFTRCSHCSEAPVRVSIPGEYMVYNALGAIAVTEHFDVTSEEIRQALGSIHVFGRNEVVPNKLGLNIMIDYAHTPSGLEAILQTVKPHTKGRVICIWGAGGNRDKAKRPVMGEISGNLADYTILTTVQVRDEDPAEIVSDIEEGIKKTKGDYTVILSRTEAIRHALSIAEKDDTIVLLGLGDKLYIEYMGEKYPYNEREIIHSIIDEILKKNIPA